MILDHLAPVIAEEGIGTAITISGHKVLSNGLAFNKLTVEGYIENRKKCYRVEIGSYKQTFFLFSEDAILESTSGWKNIKDFCSTSRYVKTTIKGLKYRCNMCREWFLPRFVYTDYCSKSCFLKCYSEDLTEHIVPVSRSYVEDDYIKEDWIPVNVVEVSTNHVSYSIRPTSLEGNNGFYVGTVLVSNSGMMF
jgi:hypothetical protein